MSSLPLDHPGRSIIAGYLGQLVASIALLHAVDRIAMGGGVMTDGALLPLVRRAAHGFLNGYLQPLRHLTQVESLLEKPALGGDAAIAGAILQAQELMGL
jgi:fructokinase